MDETGRSLSFALFMGAEGALPVFLRTAPSEMTSDIEMNRMLVPVLLELGSNQSFIRTSQRWKQHRPPQLSRAALLFQSGSPLFALRHLTHVNSFYEHG